jgi:hypothetical protein
MSLIKMIKPTGSPIPFRLLKEGRGGLVYFYQDSCPTRPSDPNDQTFTHQVGTYNATTSTGIYFALSEQCCFAANIKSHVRTHTDDNNTVASLAPRFRHKVSRLEGLDLKSQVTTRLHATLSRMGFNVTNAGVTKPYTKRSLFMVNPGMHNSSDGSENVGAYVAQAVWDYLGLKKELYPVDVEHSGFVLQHLQKPVMVSAAAAGRKELGDSGGKPSELEMFEEHEEEGEHIGDWTFEVEEREDWEAGEGQECS